MHGTKSHNLKQDSHDSLLEQPREPNASITKISINVNIMISTVARCSIVGILVNIYRCIEQGNKTQNNFSSSLG